MAHKDDGKVWVILISSHQKFNNVDLVGCIKSYYNFVCNEILSFFAPLSPSLNLFLPPFSCPTQGRSFMGQAISALPGLNSPELRRDLGLSIVNESTCGTVRRQRLSSLAVQFICVDVSPGITKLISLLWGNKNQINLPAP